MSLAGVFILLYKLRKKRQEIRDLFVYVGEGGCGAEYSRYCANNASKPYYIPSGLVRSFICFIQFKYIK